jgi:hypothetical protein
MKALVIFAALMLAGCASPKWLENRAVCTMDKKEAHVISKWGLFSIGSKLADSDAKAVCK